MSSSSSELTEDDLVEYLPLQLEIIIAEAIEIFNEKPSDARKFLMEKRVITGSAEEFASFIFSHHRLSKRLVGEYVGKADPFNQEVCENLFAMFELSGLSVDEAIRYLARQLRLPGEAQQIDRILEKFANRYFYHNPTFSLGAETIYVLFFSLIMLNTDLHNPSIARNKKMKLDQFISNLRGVNNGRDISRELLTNLYRRIKKNAISMNDEDMYESKCKEFIAPTKSGWMDKESFLGLWKKRWFILKDGCLYYFTSPLDDHPRAVIPMVGLRIDFAEEEGISNGNTDAEKSNGTSSNGYTNGDDRRNSKRRQSRNAGSNKMAYIFIVNENAASEVRMCKYSRPSKSLMSAKVATSQGGMKQFVKKMIVLRCRSDEAAIWYELLSEECHLLSEALRLQRQAMFLRDNSPEMVEESNNQRSQQEVVVQNNNRSDSFNARGDSDNNLQQERARSNSKAGVSFEMSTIVEESEGDLHSPVDSSRGPLRASKSYDVSADNTGLWGNLDDSFDVSAATVPQGAAVETLKPFNGHIGDGLGLDLSGINVSVLEEGGGIIECDDDNISIEDSVEEEPVAAFGVSPGSLVKTPAASDRETIPGKTIDSNNTDTCDSDGPVDVRGINRSARKLQLPPQAEQSTEKKRPSLQIIDTTARTLTSAKSSPHLHRNLLFGSKYGNLVTTSNPNSPAHGSSSSRRVPSNTLFASASVDNTVSNPNAGNMMSKSASFYQQSPRNVSGRSSELPFNASLSTASSSSAQVAQDRRPNVPGLPLNPRGLASFSMDTGDVSLLTGSLHLRSSTVAASSNPGTARSAAGRAGSIGSRPSNLSATTSPRDGASDSISGGEGKWSRFHFVVVIGLKFMRLLHFSSGGYCPNRSSNHWVAENSEQSPSPSPSPSPASLTDADADAGASQVCQLQRERKRQHH
jgi:cytohesin